MYVGVAGRKESMTCVRSGVGEGIVGLVSGGKADAQMQNRQRRTIGDGMFAVFLYAPFSLSMLSMFSFTTRKIELIYHSVSMCLCTQPSQTASQSANATTMTTDSDSTSVPQACFRPPAGCPSEIQAMFFGGLEVMRVSIHRVCFLRKRVHTPKTGEHRENE